jgi:transposase-like protein
MRAAPFYCPYCGEEDLEPTGDEAGGYHCASCDRRFKVRFVGLGPEGSGEP